MTRFSLNDYQQLMVRIGRYSPYNAIHSLAVLPLEISSETWSLAINTVINQLGLAHPEFSVDFKQVQFLPLSEPIVLKTRVMSLVEHVDLEMNALFGLQDVPLRFFWVVDGEENYLSITYNHWIADGHSIYRLLQSIVQQAQAGVGTQLSLQAPSIKTCYASIYQYKTAYYRCLSFLRILVRAASSYRTPCRDEESTDTGTVIHFFEPEVLERLVFYCKARGITFNDLMIAVLAQIFSRRTQEKRQAITSKWFKFKRNQVVVSVIANIRPESQVSLRSIFGLFLGFFTLSFKSAETENLEQLSQKIHHRTQRIKQNYMAIKDFLLFKIQVHLWDTQKNRRSQYRLFSKNTPITVGISNMNLNQKDEFLLQAGHCYLRVSPTAMVCPIVFNLTSFNDGLSLSINFRTTCYTRHEVEQIKQEFITLVTTIF